MDGESNKMKLLEARLTEVEKGELFAFCQRPFMVHALEKVLMYSLYQMGTVKEADEEVYDVNWQFNAASTVSDEQLGKEIRSKAFALSMLADAFNQVKKFGQEKVVASNEKNPAL